MQSSPTLSTPASSVSMEVGEVLGSARRHDPQDRPRAGGPQRSRRSFSASRSGLTCRSPRRSRSAAGGSSTRAAEEKLVEKFRHRLLQHRMASPRPARGTPLRRQSAEGAWLARWLVAQAEDPHRRRSRRGASTSGSKVEVPNPLLIEMAKSGIAVIVISSEATGRSSPYSDRIITMREGRVTGEIARNDATQEILMSMMTFSTMARPRVALEVS